MELKFLNKRFLIKACSILLIANSSLCGATESDIVNSSNAFYKEGVVYKAESLQLMNNTIEIDNALIEFENNLLSLHKTTQDLTDLKSALSVVQLGLSALEIIPEIKAPVDVLKNVLTVIQKPVSQASTTMNSIDKKIVPLINETKKVEQTTARIIEGEENYRKAGIAYLDDVDRVVKCAEDSVVLSLLTDSQAVYNESDININKINNSFSAITKKPKMLIDEITTQIDKIKVVEKSVISMHSAIKPLLNPLQELQNILNQHVDIQPSYICGTTMCDKNVQYPCGTNICNKNTSYPCGTKKCTKKVMGKKVKYSCGAKYCTKSVSYSCGVKQCNKNVPYACGVKQCKVNISLSVADIVKGAAAMESKIESMVSSVAFTALKQVGLASIIKNLEDKANDMLKTALSELPLGINPMLPSLKIDLSTDQLNGIIGSFGDLDKGLGEIEGDIQGLQKLSIDSHKYPCK